VFLIDDRLPPLNRWDEQFRGIVHEGYVLRGAEISLKGTVEIRDGKFISWEADNGRTFSWRRSAQPAKLIGSGQRGPSSPRRRPRPPRIWPSRRTSAAR
jgi:hypothetical protein